MIRTLFSIHCALNVLEGNSKMLQQFIIHLNSIIIQITINILRVIKKYFILLYVIVINEMMISAIQIVEATSRSIMNKLT